MAVQHYKFGKYKLVHEYFYKPVLPPPFVIFSWGKYIINYMYAAYKHGTDKVSMSAQFVEMVDNFRGGKHAMRRVYMSAAEIHEKVLKHELDHYGQQGLTSFLSKEKCFYKYQLPDYCKLFEIHNC